MSFIPWPDLTVMASQIFLTFDHLDNFEDKLSNILQNGFHGGTVLKSPYANAGDTGLIPRLGRSPGGGNGNSLQYSCWDIPWTEEPGGQQSMGSQTFGHDLGAKQQVSIQWPLLVVFAYSKGTTEDEMAGWHH